MAAADPTILGAWKLASYYVESIDTGTRTEMFGAHPRGRLLFLANGLMSALITSQDQAADGKLIAYSGRYRLDPPDRFVTSVDMAWIPAWVGTDQSRAFHLDGDTLEIFTDPGRPPGADGPVRAVMAWTRET